MQKLDSFLHAYYHYLLFGIGFCIFIFCRIVDFNGLYGQDAYEYYNYADDLSNFWQKGGSLSTCHFPIFYPLISSFWGLLFPLKLTMQAISITSFILVFHFLKKIISILYPDLAYISSYLLFGGVLSPYFFRLGICIMSDMLGIASICALLFYSLSFCKTNKLSPLIFALICAFIAIMTRYASLLLILPPLLAMIYHAYQTNYLAKLLPILSISFILVLSFIYLKKNYLYSLTTHTAYINWSFFNFFRTHFEVAGEGSWSYLFPNIIYGIFHYFHPAYLLLSPILLFFVHKKDIQIPLFVLFSAGTYVIFLMGFPTQNIRLQTFMMPFILILFANSFQRFYEYFIFRYNISTLFFISFLLISLILIYFSSQSLLHFNQTEKFISLKIKKIESPAIYTLGMEGALKAYKIPFPIHSLYNENIDSVSENTLILLPPNFSIQWKGHLAMQNWNFIQKHYHITQAFPLPDNWEIWEIHHLK